MVVKEHQLDLNKALETLLNSSFELSCKDKQYVHNFLDKEFFPKLRIVINEFNAFLDEPISSRKDLSDVFSKQNTYVYAFSLQANTMLYFRFLKGTMVYLQASIMTYCATYTDEKMRMDYIADALIDMKAHFEYLYQDLLQSYDKPAKV